MHVETRRKKKVVQMRFFAKQVHRHRKKVVQMRLFAKQVHRHRKKIMVAKRGIWGRIN